MARNVVKAYIKPKRKSHPHSKNASKGKTGYIKKYRGQGRWENLEHQVEQARKDHAGDVYAQIEMNI